MSSLFSEITIKGLKIKNRIVMPPMVNFGFAATDGLVNDRHIQHYKARSRGGVGLIIVEATCINKNGRLDPSQLGLWSDSQIEGLSKISQVCHSYDARVIIQIHHAGLHAHKDVSDSLISPSDFRGKSRMGEDIFARALTISEIHVLQSEYIASALRAKTAGFDGVELHGAHGYLIDEFLSPLANKRADLYGGNLTNRSRFVTEIVTGIREATGDSFIIGCRMGSNEPDLKSGIQIAQVLEKAGVDLLHVSAGFASREEADLIESAHVPKGFNYHWIVYDGTEIKRNVHVPVIVVSGIRIPKQANDLIERGLADLTAIGKGLFIDPRMG